MKINLGHVLTNAIATLVAAVFVGAMAIVWTGATSVGDEVARATKDIRATNEQMQKTNVDIQRTNNNILQQHVNMEAASETLIEEIAGLKAELATVREDYESLHRTMAEWRNEIGGALPIQEPNQIDPSLKAQQSERIRSVVRQKGAEIIQQIQQRGNGN